MDVTGKAIIDSNRGRNGELVSTDLGLLARLRDLHDQAAWQEFYHLYWKLIHRAAIKAGLVEQEAEEVVQEVLICVARQMESFRYEPEKCSFKGWLMHLTRRRIIDHHRRRRTRSERFESRGLDTESPAAQIPDLEAERAFERMWTAEWELNLLNAAEQRVRRNVKPEHYMIYHLRCVMNLSVREVSQKLRVNVLTIRVISHRVARKMKREVQRLEKQRR